VFLQNPRVALIMGRRIIIVIGGLHGTGKSTCAKLLAERLGLRYVSAGEIFRAVAKKKGMTIEEFSNYAEKHHEIDRDVDSRVIQASKEGNVVLEGQIAANLVEAPDLRIFLTAPENVRIDRLSSRDGKNREESLRETRIRETSERKRYMETYGIDVADLKNYNLIIDTSKWSAQSVTRIIQSAVDEYLRGKA
jgi:cytidylate kinase